MVAPEAGMSSHAGTRVARLLRALADSPEPMSTRQLVDVLAEGIKDAQRALTLYGNALRRQELKGHVVFAGYRNGQAALWCITDPGRGQLARWEAAP